MTSVVSICNLALSNLGAENISALSDAGAEARACRQFYEQTRDALLQVYPWRFAGKTQALAQITNTEAGKWGYAYSRPNDCLKVRWVRPQYSVDDPCAQTHQQEISNPHDVEGDVIFCDLSPAFLRYTFKISDPTKFPPLFVETLSWHLTARLAMPLTRDLKMRNDAYQLSMQTRAQAEMADANEARETSDHSSELVEARDGYERRSRPIVGGSGAACENHWDDNDVWND